MNPTDSRTPSAAAEHVQAAFLLLLPRIRHVARWYFRHVRCPDRRDDCVCEAVALCWVWYARLVRRGRDPETFVTTLARYGAAAVHRGRGVGGHERTRDVLSAACQRRRGFRVAPLPPGSSLDGTVFDEALHDNTQTPVPDQVQFRVDFPAWVGSLPAPKSRLMARLAEGGRTTDLAREFGLSEGRISQLRKEFRTSYAVFCGDAVAGRTRPAENRQTSEAEAS